MSNWLDAEEWKRVQAVVPIACVDVVPLRMDGSGGAVGSIGLILRDTPHQGRRWCLVGGRVWRDEPLSAAVARHLRQTLGEHVRFTIDPDAQPAYVAQYFTARQPVGVIDPRQHSIAATYCLPIDGPIHAAGEAHEFRWFARGQLPPPDQFGFEQDRVLAECLRRSGLGSP